MTDTASHLARVLLYLKQRPMTMTTVIDTPRETPKHGSQSTMVCVYGYGPSKNPFYKEAQTLKLTSKGCVLILSAPVSRGQKLLLMNGVQGNPVEAEIVMTRPLGAQMCEVEVCFPA
jgi:hypothetical protein